MGACKSLIGFAAFKRQYLGSSGIIDVLACMRDNLRLLLAHAGKTGRQVNHAIMKIDIHSRLTWLVFDRDNGRCSDLTT